MRDMDAIREEYGERGVVVLAVNVWEEEGPFRSYVEGSELGLRWVRADEETTRAFGFSGVPTQVLIDRGGTVRWTSGFLSIFSGADGIRKQVDRVLEEQGHV